MQRSRTSIVCAASVLAVGIGMMGHEASHVVTGWLAGGSPTLLTATEVKGDFDALSPAGIATFGASGSVFNAVLCLLAWGALRRESVVGARRLVAWFFFAVNGMLVTTKMVGEAAVGWGDWMTVLGHLPATTATRLVVVVAGLVGLVVLVRSSGAQLGTVVAAGEPDRRVAEARRVVLVGAAAALLLALGGSVANPVGTTRAALLALGAVLGPFIPMMAATRFVRRHPPLDADPPATAAWPWLLAAAVTTGVLWLVVGPGLPLEKLLI